MLICVLMVSLQLMLILVIMSSSNQHWCVCVLQVHLYAQSVEENSTSLHDIILFLIILKMVHSVQFTNLLTLSLSHLLDCHLKTTPKMQI